MRIVSTAQNKKKVNQKSTRRRFNLKTNIFLINDKSLRIVKLIVTVK